VVAQIAGMTPVPGANYIEKLLPIIAPIVMSYLAKKLVAGGGKSTTAEATRHLTGLTRRTGAAAEAGAARLGRDGLEAPRRTKRPRSSRRRWPSSTTFSPRSSALPAHPPPSPGSPPTRPGWPRFSAVCSAAESVRSRRCSGLGRRDLERPGQRLLVRERWPASPRRHRGSRHRPRARERPARGRSPGLCGRTR
jgi:hypothetical protein